MSIHLFRGVLLCTLLALGCTTLGLSANTPSASTTQPAIVTANNTFGFQLYSELAKKGGQQNLFISPLSLEYALTMTANGAHGETFTQMAKTLGWGAMPLPQVNAGFQALTKRMQTTDPKVQITLANSLWMPKDTALPASFVQTNNRYFGAEVRTVNMTDPSTVPAMNAWVNKKTNGMIPTLVQQGDLDINTLLVLLNALYFKGEWTTSFAAKLTTSQPFTAGDGTRPTVKMMRRTGTWQYYVDDQVQMARLPYGDGAMSMLIILPRAGKTLDTVAQSVFTQTTWHNYRAKLAPHEGTLCLPRFKANYSTNLNDALQALGMTDAFNAGNGAEFFGAPKRSIWIQIVRHKTALEVSEAGTKAAAATEVVIETKSVQPSRFSMIVDHPFLFAIQHKDGALLFLGSIMKPE